jgi:hypothetical protein
MILKRNFKPHRRRQKRQLNTSVQVFTGSARVDALGINLSDVAMCLFALANLPLNFFRLDRTKWFHFVGLFVTAFFICAESSFWVDPDHRPGSWADAAELPACTLFTPSESVADPKQLSIADVETLVALTTGF